MDKDLERKVNVVVGLFVVSCLATAFIYGPAPIIACVVGLFIVGALVRAFRDRTPRC